MNQKQLAIDSAIGPLYLIASETHLLGLHWSEQDVEMVGKSSHTSVLLKTEKQLKDYFKGKLQVFDIPMFTQGTPFQKSVWKQLSKIPYGETRSYQDVAGAIDNPKACRAVGTANGANPISIIVPCHRVIAANGTLGGFGGGLGVKVQLLELEKCIIGRQG